MSNNLKTPLFSGLNRFSDRKIQDAAQQAGKALPCHVVAVTGAIVTVAFDVETDATLPQVTIPIIGAEYIRLPIRIGDKGVTIAADVRIGNISGLGGSAPRLDLPGNMTALVFVPIGNATWSEVDPDTLVLYSVPGVRIEVSPTSISIIADVAVTGKLSTTAELEAGNGATGTFTSADSKTITVTKGIVTSIV